MKYQNIKKSLNQTTFVAKQSPPLKENNEI